MKIVTFNLRCVWIGDGINGFIHRAGMVFEKIDNERPDVICFQECKEKHADFFERHMPEYQLIYNGRLEDRRGEGLATAVRKETVEVLGQDCFWLSPTPNVPGSRFPEQSDCPRICQVLLLRIKGTDEPFWVYNNHLDHRSDLARILGIRQVMERVQQDQSRAKLPVFLMGDFNALPGSETVRYCDEYKEFPIRELTGGCEITFHDFGRKQAPYRIDYIYADEKTARREHKVELWTDELDGIFLSDHYPICLTIGTL